HRKESDTNTEDIHARQGLALAARECYQNRERRYLVQGRFTETGSAREHMPESIDPITLRRPDDWHVHLRDGAMLAAVLPFTTRQFARAIAMPNLVPPVTDVAAGGAYRERILAAVPAGTDFAPLMTCYLTDTTDPEEV